MALSSNVSLFSNRSRSSNPSDSDIDFWEDKEDVFFSLGNLRSYIKGKQPLDKGAIGKFLQITSCMKKVPKKSHLALLSNLGLIIPKFKLHPYVWRIKVSSQIFRF